MNDPLQPPFRILSLDDFLRYCLASRKYSSEQTEELSTFIRSGRFKPGAALLDRLPPQVNLSLQLYKTRAVVESGLSIQKLSQLDMELLQRNLRGVSEHIRELIAGGDLIAAARRLNQRFSLRSRLQKQRERFQHALEAQNVLGISDHLHALLRDLLVAYLTVSKKDDPEIAYLKDLLLVITVFDPENQDVLTELQRKEIGPELAEFLAAEILFRRLPKTIQRLLGKNSEDLKQLYLKQIDSLPLRPNHKRNIRDALRSARSQEDFAAALEKISAMAGRFRLPETTRRKIIDLGNLYQSREKMLFRFYDGAFLTRQLAILRPLYLRSSQVQVNFKRKLVRMLVQEKILTIYPTKDFHDYFKGIYSNDCTREPKLAAGHLLTREFLNLRIFRGKRWIGNIYVLDLTRSHRAIVVDRIQLAKGIKIYAPVFFKALRESLVRLFQNVDYDLLLTPSGVISNFHFLQSIYDNYKSRRKMPPVCLLGISGKFKIFESFREKPAPVFLIFHSRNSSGRDDRESA